MRFFATLFFACPLLAPALAQRFQHVVEVRTQTTFMTLLRRQAPFANSTSSTPAPTWNASAAFTFTPSNTSASAGANSTSSGGGGLGGILTGLLGPITSGLLGPSGILGPITSGGLNASGVATGVSNVTSSLSLSRPTISSLSLSLLSSSVRWPNSSSVAAPTSQANSTSRG